MNNFVSCLLTKQRIKKRHCAFSPKKAQVSAPLRREDSLGMLSSGKYSRGKSSRGKFFRKSLGKPAFRPASVLALFEQNSRLIEKIQQDPARINRRHGNTRPLRRDRPVTGDQAHGMSGSEGGRNIQRGRRLSFTLPAISVITVFFMAMGIFFVFHSQNGSLDWTNREVIGAEKDKASSYNLAVYAGVGQGEKPGAKTAEKSGDKVILTEAGENVPLDLTETFAWQSYKVKKGDSVSKIAAAFSVSMDAIIASNGIRNARALREGEALRIPNMDGIPYAVKSGDSLSKISKSMGVPLEAILDANDIQSDVITAGMSLFIPGARMNKDDLKLALGELFIYPVKGARVSSPFGWRDDPFGSGARLYHSALDLSVPQGTPVKAAMDGEVLMTTSGDRTYGNFIILGHSGGLKTMYAHLSTVLVRKGERVIQGAKIGTVGSTGLSTGPHLHFGVFKNNRAVNPLDFLNSTK